MNPKKQLLKTLTVTLGLGLVFISTSSVLAQYTTPTDEGYQSNEKDSLYGDGITGINPMELIHRANLSNGRSYEEFNEDSNLQIKDSAENFRQLQQQLILEQYQNKTEVDE